MNSTNFLSRIFITYWLLEEGNSWARETRSVFLCHTKNWTR